LRHAVIVLSRAQAPLSDAGDQVGGAGAGGGATHAEFAGFPRIAIGHEGGTGFVTRHHRARPATALAAGKGVEQRFDRAAGHTEDVFHANDLQVGHQQIGNFQLMILCGGGEDVAQLKRPRFHITHREFLLVLARRLPRRPACRSPEHRQKLPVPQLALLQKNTHAALRRID
jgi:hypothetical protein